MGQPAARVGDLTSHGTPLGPGPGCPTVLIGGLPAWRATSDMHAGPLVRSEETNSALVPSSRAGAGHPTHPRPPPGPGPGCPTLLIGGLPAWRATSDMHACPLV